MSKIKCSELEEGKPDQTGEIIQDIIGRSDTLCVYLVANDVIKIACDTPGPLTPWASTVHREYDRLLGRICRAVPTKHAQSLRHDLGAAVFNALSVEGNGCKLEDFFGGVQEDLAQRSKEYSRVAYVLGSVAAAVPIGVFLLLCLLAGLPSADLSAFYFGIAGGAVGAVVSVMLRSDSLQADPYANRYFVAFQGFLRTGLGALFGVLFISAVKAGVLLTSAAGNLYGLFLLSTVAGYSEKFVPEIMSRLESQNSNAGKSGPAAAGTAATGAGATPIQFPQRQAQSS